MHMTDHPAADALVELARKGTEATEQQTTHAHCLVCDECRAVLDTVLLLRGLLDRPIASVPLPATAAGIQ